MNLTTTQLYVLDALYDESLGLSETRIMDIIDLSDERAIAYNEGVLAEALETLVAHGFVFRHRKIRGWWKQTPAGREEIERRFGLNSSSS